MATYCTFKETEDHDLAIEDGRFVFVEDQDYIIQQIGTALRQAKHDWFYNIDEGLRYIDDDQGDGILGASNLSLENEAEIISIITNIPGVLRILRFETEFLTNNHLLLTASVLTEFSRTEVEVTALL